WTPPQGGTIKINTDGSVIGDRGGYGGIAIDSRSQCLFSYSGKGDAHPVTYQEMFAIKRGLELGLERGVEKVICETDSMQMLAYIRDNKTPPLRLLYSSSDHSIFDI
ncbi:hypothetical protein GIB67_000357, partial [Kingdonia uniflora]